MAARTPALRSLLRASRTTLLRPTGTFTALPSTLPRTRNSARLPSHRTYATSDSKPVPPPIDAAAQLEIDNKIEAITELYNTARDEFEMAVEETEKETIYAAEDRAACREALNALLKYYNNVVIEGRDARVREEVSRRVGQRIRELEGAVLGLEESVGQNSK